MLKGFFAEKEKGIFPSFLTKPWWENGEIGRCGDWYASSCVTWKGQSPYKSSYTIPCEKLTDLLVVAKSDKDNGKSKKAKAIKVHLDFVWDKERHVASSLLFSDQEEIISIDAHNIGFFKRKFKNPEFFFIPESQEPIGVFLQGEIVGLISPLGGYGWEEKETGLFYVDDPLGKPDEVQPKSSKKSGGKNKKGRLVDEKLYDDLNSLILKAKESDGSNPEMVEIIPLPGIGEKWKIRLFNEKDVLERFCHALRSSKAILHGTLSVQQETGLKMKFESLSQSLGKK